jgi:hypothetical protein
MLVIATTSGFALGGLNRAEGSGQKRTVRAPQHAPSAAELSRAQQVNTLNASMDRLLTRRLVALHRMNSARDGAAQAHQAARLARAYQLALASSPRGSRAPLDFGPVRRLMRTTERAYLALAVAARSGDVLGYRAARRTIAAREHELERAVTGLARLGLGVSRAPGA